MNKKSIKKRNKKVKENKKNILVFAFISLIIILVIALIVLISVNNRKLTCTNETEKKDGVSQNNNIVFYLKSNKIKKIDMTRKISVSIENSMYDYLDVFKTSLDSIYKESDIEYEITKKDGILTVNLTYDKEKSYILDSPVLSLENEAINVSVIGNDINNQYLDFDLNKKYQKSQIINIMKDKGYSCK